MDQAAEPRFDLAAIRRYVESIPAEPPQVSQAEPKKNDRLTLASILALAGGNAMDAGGTIYALQHGARETNPAYGDHPSAAKVLALKGAGTAAQWYLLHQLAKKKPKAANVIAKVLGGANAAVGVNNLRHAREER